MAILYVCAVDKDDCGMIVAMRSKHDDEADALHIHFRNPHRVHSSPIFYSLCPYTLCVSLSVVKNAHHQIANI